MNMGIKRGFTLIEVAVTTLIFIIVVAALFSVLNISDTANYKSLGQIDLQAQVRSILNWIANDVRQTSTRQIQNSSPPPTLNHIKFRKVAGIIATGPDAGTHDYVPNPYIEYTYDSGTLSLRRNEIDATTGSVLWTTIFDNITQPPFPDAAGINGTNPLMLIIISAQKQLRYSEIINWTLSEEVKIRN